MLAVHPPPHRARTLALAGAALAAGLMIAVLPLPWGGVGLAGLVVVGLALWEPAIAVGAALTLGPTRAYLAAAGYYGPQFDFGQVFFGLALAGWLARGALRRELALPRLGLYLPLAAWIAVGLLSLFGAAEWRDGLNESLKWVEVAGLMAITLDAAQRGRINWILAAVLLAGALQAGLGWWQYALRGTGPESFRLPDGHYRAYGTFEQPNPFGGFLGLIWPVAAGLGLGYLETAFTRWRARARRASATSLGPPKPGLGFGISDFGLNLLPSLALAAVTALLLVGLYVSFSRGAWLGAAAAGLVLAALWPRRLSLGLGIVAAGLAAGFLLVSAGLAPASITGRLENVLDFVSVADVRGLNINDANFALVERLAHWQAAQAMAEAHPWLGVGLGNYVAAYPQYAFLNWPFHLGHAHNIYLHTLAETGVLGLAAYGAFWAGAIILTLRTIRRATGWQRGLALGLLGVWVHLLAHQIVDNLHVNNNDLLLGTYLGILYALNDRRNQSFGQTPHPRTPAAD
jgi:O-antigen ligase